MITYGLIGFPLQHSFSSTFFNEKFKREKVDARYHNFELKKIEEIDRVIRTHEQLRGLNVTIPYKEVVIPYLDALSPESEKIGAVNVIRIDRSTDRSRPYRLTGFNTDYIGFRDSLLPLLEGRERPKALILGTGGASKAVAEALNGLSIAWRYVSRKGGNNRLSYGDLNAEIIAEYRLIVNTTPLGMFPHCDAAPDLPYDSLTPHHLLYDLVYNPSETRFLQKGRALGATVKNGAEMLRLQALAAWDIWNKPDR